MEIQAPYGPTRSAVSVPPTACPVVPPGSGMLNIIPRKEKAAATPRSGSFPAGSSALIFFMEMVHAGIITAVITAQVCGLK